MPIQIEHQRQAYEREQRKQHQAIVRDHLWHVQNGRCFYCRCHVARDDATFDHRVPKSLGGEVSLANGVMACLPCNASKADALVEPKRGPKHARKINAADAAIRAAKAERCAAARRNLSRRQA